MQPIGPHVHWHVDVSYLNLGGTFYYLCSLLDGYSRFIVHWEIRESMTEQDVETIVQPSRVRCADLGGLRRLGFLPNDRRYFVPGGTTFFTWKTRLSSARTVDRLGDVLREMQEKWPSHHLVEAKPSCG